MDKADGESFILPILENDDDVGMTGMTHCSSWTIVTTASEKLKSTPANDGDRISTTSVVGLDDSFPANLSSLDGTDLKNDGSIVAFNDLLDQPVDAIENRKRISQISFPSSGQKASKEPSRTSKDRILFFCLAFLLMATITLTLQLNISTQKNFQLQEELNQTATLLKSYRAHQQWTMDREIKDDTSSFEIENCWMEASVTLGPCASDPLGNMIDAYTKSYEELSSYVDEAWKWWTVLPNDSGPTYFNSDSNDSNTTYSHSDSNDSNTTYFHSDSTEVSSFEWVVKSVALNLKKASMHMYLGMGSSNTTLDQSHLWSVIESWFGGGSKSGQTSVNQTQDEGDSLKPDSFIDVLQKNAILRSIYERCNM